jgi:hypothetical protein
MHDSNKVYSLYVYAMCAESVSPMTVANRADVDMRATDEDNIAEGCLKGFP